MIKIFDERNFFILRHVSHSCKLGSKTLVDWLILFQACDGDTDTKNLITVCKTNLIVSSVLAKDSQNRTLTFDFSLHPSFPIIKLS